MFLLILIITAYLSGALYHKQVALNYINTIHVAIIIEQMHQPPRHTQELVELSSSNDDRRVTVHDHPQHRLERFPSVEQRIQLYMSNWYQPPCSSETKSQYVINFDNFSFPTLKYTGPGDEDHGGASQHVFESKMQVDVKLLLEEKTVADCARDMTEWEEQEKRPHTEGRVLRRPFTSPYCKDAMEMLNITKEMASPVASPVASPREEEVSSKNRATTMASPVASPVANPKEEDVTEFHPMILQMGDDPTLSKFVPVFSKYRSSLSRDELDLVTEPSTCSTRLSASKDPTAGLAPIIWNLNSGRHFGPLLEAARSHDIPWNEKRNGTLWRGGMTGFVEERPDATPLDQCLSNTRCRFVYESRQRNSSLIDAAITLFGPQYRGGGDCNC